VNPKIDLKNILILYDEIKKEVELHPGIYTKEGHQEFLIKCRFDSDAEICSSDCSICTFKEGSKECIDKLNSRKRKLLKEAITSYCASVEMGIFIKEKENNFAGK